MNFLKKSSSRILLVVVYLLSGTLSFVYTLAVCDPTKQICNPIKADTIDQFISDFLNGALKFGLPIITLAVIYCGFLFVEARGNPEKITKAKEALLYTLIGAAILLGSWAIAHLVSSTVTGLSIINISLWA
jgi:hypothetical protein